MIADARSIEAMGALPLAVVTAITVQSGSGVKGFAAVPASRVKEQLGELFAGLPVAAVKVGQIPNAAIAAVVARRVRDSGLVLVLDPVLAASGGGSLVTKGGAKAIAALLLPLCSLVTVNLPEAGVLTGRRVAGKREMAAAARELADLGAGAVLVKGGHLRGDPVDLLLAGGRETWLGAARIAGSMHGTGCALASAAAARLALGDDLEDAVRKAREHVRGLLQTAISLGRSRLRAPRQY